MQTLLSHQLQRPVFPCHRLDAGTGGVLLFALDEAAAQAARGLFAQRTLQKHYQCLCLGQPQPQAELHDFLQKDASRGCVRITRTPQAHALPVFTEYRLLAQGEGLSLLQVALHTGRTHQIRAHLAFHQLPLLGDDKYGNRQENRRRHARTPALWAVALTFPAVLPPCAQELAAKTFTSTPPFGIAQGRVYGLS